MICPVCKKKEISKKEFCSICYARNYRKKHPEVAIAYKKRTKERRKENRLIYYERNKEKLNQGSRDYRRKTNNAHDKSGERKENSLIRSKTRHIYPLTGERCVECGSKAEHRHHTTEPMEVDKFLFLCTSCHDKIHGIRRFAKDNLDERKATPEMLRKKSYAIQGKEEVQ